jgi:SAM-dependent methyltransferase
MNDTPSPAELSEAVAVGCGLEGCPLTTRDEVSSQGWRFLACRRCRQMRLPPDCLTADRVDPDPVGRLSLAMRILFGMRMAWLTRAVPRYGDRDAAWLDAGCGDGQFLEYLTASGYKRAVGMEPDALRAENARKRGAAVYDSTEAAMAATGIERFDLVTLWHVVEHVPQPADLLGYYAALLAPGGALVFQVPNHESAQTGLFGRWSAFPDYGRHLWFHNPALVEWTREAVPGYEVGRLRDFNFEYEIYGWVDTFGSAMASRQNFIHRRIKKGEGTQRDKFVGAAAAAALLPFATLSAAASLATGRGSTLTVMVRRPQ